MNSPQGCCNGAIYDLSASGCCGNQLYNLATQRCCDGVVVQGTSCGGGGNGGACSIAAESILQDGPRDNAWTPLPDGGAVYGGSIPPTADNLKLTAKLTSGAPVSLYTWSATPSGIFTPPTPSANANVWDVGDIPPAPGIVTFQCIIKPQSGSDCTATFKVEIGVRTDDVILVGWINPAAITLPPPILVAPGIVAAMPVTGPPATTGGMLACNAIMGQLTAGLTTIATPAIVTLTPVDRTYILNWAFMYGGNTNPLLVLPGGNFLLADGIIGYSKVNLFANTPTNYKMFNHLQIRYLLSPSGGFKGTPHAIRSGARIGTTVSPCDGSLWAGQAAALNGWKGVNPGNSRFSQINDGSPDALAVMAINVLTGKNLGPGATPVFWEDIGSCIRFTASAATTPIVAVQPYPTYIEFWNGVPVATYPQAPAPIGNFATNPHPFGTVPCLLNGTPGGRCGNAGPPADPSARIPPSGYTVP